MTDEKKPASSHEPALLTTDAPKPPVETKVCANCGEPAAWSSPDDGAMNVVSFCARHKPVNAPKK